MPRGARLGVEPHGTVHPWPTGSGFEHFYGFRGREINQWYPALYDGITPVEPAKTPEEGYHFTEDMTDHAINWVRQQKALMPDKPFFMYYAPGATHAPHHVAPEWSDKYRGRFDAGWDALRQRDPRATEGAGCRPRRHRAHASTGGDPSLGRRRRRPQTHPGPTDGGLRRIHGAHRPPVGRLFDTLDELGELDDTLIYLIIGDNGASAEGTPNGTFNEIISLNGAAAFETTEFMAARIDQFGSPAAYNHYAVGWAHAMNTPYQWTKQVASHFGGTRNGTIVHWPNGFEAKGEIRNQFHHVIDVAATMLQVAGLPEPAFVNGIQQIPYHGVSHALCLRPVRRRRSAVKPSTSRWPATEASTTRAGLPSPGIALPGTSGRPPRARR